MTKVKAKVLKYMISEKRRAKIKIIINEVPLSKNIYVNMHWAKRKKYKEWIEELIFYHCDIKGLHAYKKATINFDIYFETNRKRDIQNYLGGGLISWLDALVSLCIIADDSYDVIGQPNITFNVDKHNPRTEITIQAIDKLEGIA